MKRLLTLLFILNNCIGIAQTFVEDAFTVGIDHVYHQELNMGGGVLFFDYDNDGWEDLYLTGGLAEDTLYKNKGDGTFQKITNVGLSITKDYNTIAVVSGDLNNDGHRDLFVTTWKKIGSSLGRNLLFINNGDGTFTESGTSWGLTETSFTMGALLLDYNKDGLLDIYAINYIKIPGQMVINNGQITAITHQCAANHLYENNGNNTFTEKGAALGVDNSGCALAAMPSDFDKDNDQDIYVANDFGEYIIPNALYQNNFPNANFSEVSKTSKLDTGIYAMGIACGDIDKDEDLDYYITNLGRNILLENNGSQVFTDISTTAGTENTYALDAGNLYTTSWGTAFLDANNDTWPDLFVANGKVPASAPIATGEQDPNMLYINNGDKTFASEKVSAHDANRGRGMAYCDYDKDGDLDVVVVNLNSSTNSNAKTAFFKNVTNPKSGSGKNWVQFKLTGSSINKDAMGAKVNITVNGEKLIGEVHGQGSHCSQHSLVLHFGLANATTIDKVEIIWSEKSKQTFTNVAVNKQYNFTEGNTSLSVGEFNTTTAIKTFPNPMQDKLYFQNLETNSTLEIFNVQGRSLRKATVSPNVKYIDISELPSGVYFIKIENYKQEYNQLILKS